MSDFLTQFAAARRVGTPLIAVRTPDAMATLQGIVKAVGKDVGVAHWDVMRGVNPANEKGAGASEAINQGGDPSMASARPTDALSGAARMPEDSILFLASAHRFWTDAPVCQAIWNLRDQFKADGRTLVMLVRPGSVLPDEISQDVLLLDEPLPSEQDLAAIVSTCFTDAGLDAPAAGVVSKAVDALVGLAAFPAEQVVAMSLKKAGLDFAGLWERKRQVIEQAPGLSVWRGGETFDQIGGCSNVKTFLRRLVGGRRPPRVIVFIDEIEKAFAGFGTDTSGVKTEMTGTMLSEMQDMEYDGCIFIGPPGAAKSAVAKATGNTAEVPTIAFDLAAMQASLVGESGTRLRAALAIVRAVSQGRALFIATCNSIGVLPPELRRRFSRGTFFFDLPSAEERSAIWPIYMAKYGIAAQALPDDAGWTGAEIKECCKTADALQCTLTEAADYVVPVSRSAAEQIRTLREQASGKFISASEPGVYQYRETAPAGAGRSVLAAKVVAVPGRKMAFND